MGDHHATLATKIQDEDKPEYQFHQTKMITAEDDGVNWRHSG
jgi:hypothetical protein